MKEVIWKTYQNSKIKAVIWRCFCLKIFLKIFQNSQLNIFAGVSFLIKLQAGNLKLSEAAIKDVLWIRCSWTDTLVFQNQPFLDPLQNKCYWIIGKIHRKKTVLESLFNKATVSRTCNFIKEDSDTGASLWNFQDLQIFRTIILKNICECLLLNFV